MLRTLRSSSSSSSTGSIAALPRSASTCSSDGGSPFPLPASTAGGRRARGGAAAEAGVGAGTVAGLGDGAGAGAAAGVTAATPLLAGSGRGGGGDGELGLGLGLAGEGGGGYGLAGGDEVLVLERRKAPLVASCMAVVARFKFRLGLTAGVLALLLVGAVFFSSASSAETEPGDELIGVGRGMPYKWMVDMSGPLAYFKVVVTGPPREKLGGSGNATGSAVHIDVALIAVVDGVESAVGDAWRIELESEESTEEEKRIPGPDTHFDALPGAPYLFFEISTNSPTPIGLQLHVVQLSEAAAYQVLFAAVILVVVYVFIVFELLHRVIAAMLGSFITLATLAAIDERPSLETIIGWIEYETVCLLFGMMVMVGIFSTTGFFEWVAVKAYKFSNGDINRLVVVLCVFTAILSAFLDNVTTILLLTPVTIQLCTVLSIDPVPLLVAEVVFSNIGGTATAIGDPPNVIIVSDSRVSAAGVGFLDLTLNLAPGAILATLAAYVFLKWQYGGLFDNVKPLTPLEQEVEVWRKTLKRTPVGSTPEEARVRELLVAHIEQLEDLVAAEANEGGGGNVSIAALEAKYKIHDAPLFVSCATVLFVVILLFFLQSVFKINLNLAWISILGALTMLIVSGIHDIEEVLEKGLGELGLITYIGDVTSEAIKSVPAQSRLAVALLLILWISALVSSFLDNIPFVTAMIPVVLQLGSDPEVNLPLAPLVYALAFGSCMGGNGTLIGASANVVAAGLALQAGHDISFNRYFRTGFPVMIVSVCVVSLYLMVVHVWILG
ncbi:tyrosine transporter [Thecamonas trahens ATCC 50062]|uniref:Tyrosine transporter n=1 Tax=Thecamonas trahens ATCC 50062 TaxID=461836 RepID=A0A0L0DBE0_THETB|nr:tyrosine transporter [Thecamonas trahens ATCC 50062]KNC49431.1 tyrosine transporter [Thecamonas trahens ATCC 50062]|eukprot:XP_013757853.1 tyrosine transporter [Thecamonas trahens ATCC 50062]